MKSKLKKHFLKYSNEEKFEFYWNTPRESFLNNNVENWIKLMKTSSFEEKEIFNMLKKDIDELFTGEIMGA